MFKSIWVDKRKRGYQRIRQNCSSKWSWNSRNQPERRISKLTIQIKAITLKKREFEWGYGDTGWKTHEYFRSNTQDIKLLITTGMRIRRVEIQTLLDNLSKNISNPSGQLNINQRAALAPPVSKQEIRLNKWNALIRIEIIDRISH